MPPPDRATRNTQLDLAPTWREMMRFYKVLKPAIWLMKLPLVGQLLSRIWVREGSDANWFIPVAEPVTAGKEYVLPGEIVARLLRATDGIFAMSACPCRTAFKCKDHPRGLGCLQLGPAVRGIPADVGGIISLQEALHHLQTGLSAGLTPTILHIESQADTFEVDKAGLLSICFCCECCCDVRLLLRDGPDRYWDQYSNRLPGIELVVGDRCTLCGDCLSACYGGERVIEMGARHALINDRCIGCGLCIPVCPEGAIEMRIAPDIDLVSELLDRVSERAQVWAGGDRDGRLETEDRGQG